MPFISYNKTVCFPKDLYIEFSLTDGECVKGFIFTQVILRNVNENS